MTIAITAKLFLNGSWLKDVIIRNTIDDFIMEIRPEILTEHLVGPATPLLPDVIHFKQAYFSDDKFYAWGVPRRIENVLRAAEEKNKRKLLL